MPEQKEEAEDTEADGAVPKPPPASRSAAQCVAGLGGGIVGAVCLGLVGVLIGAALAGSRWDDASGGLLITGLGVVGAVLGLLLGIVLGSRAAGTNKM